MKLLPSKAYVVCLRNIVTEAANDYRFFIGHDGIFFDPKKAQDRVNYIFEHLDKFDGGPNNRCIGAWVTEVKVCD